MSERAAKIAGAIFDWLNRPSTDGDDGAPHTYNPDPDALEIGVDGELDCKKLAAAIDAALKDYPATR